MKKSYHAWIICLIIFIFSTAAGRADTIPVKSQTTLKLYATAQQAYEKWKKNPEQIKILDVRTPGEYIFVGHAPMAVNVPIKFLEQKTNPITSRPSMSTNKNFLADIQKKYGKDDIIFVMCRSGARSAAAINVMADAGYKNVYNITDGFEGGAVRDKSHADYEKRVVNGWKNSGAPWTYKLEKGLVY